MTRAPETILSEMTVRKAAEEFAVPRSTLHDRVSGKVQYGCKSGPRKYLNSTEEMELANFITGCCSFVYSCTKKQLCAAIYSRKCTWTWDLCCMLGMVQNRYDWCGFRTYWLIELIALREKIGSKNWNYLRPTCQPFDWWYRKKPWCQGENLERRTNRTVEIILYYWSFFFPGHRELCSCLCHYQNSPKWHCTRKCAAVWLFSK